MPKSFFKTSPGRYEAARLPKTDVTRAGIIIIPTSPPSIRPLLLWTERLIAAVGRKAMRLVACATCCSTPVKIVRKGIRIVPPPIPIPPKSPEKKPAARNIIKLKTASLSPQGALLR